MEEKEGDEGPFYYSYDYPDVADYARFASADHRPKDSPLVTNGNGGERPTPDSLNGTSAAWLPVHTLELQVVSYDLGTSRKLHNTGSRIEFRLYLDGVERWWNKASIDPTAPNRAKFPHTEHMGHTSS